MILEHEHVRRTYIVSANEMGAHGYGVLMLTRQDCYFYEKNFEITGMGRSLLIAEPLNADFIVATAHFESLNSAEKRKSQMNESFNILKNSGIQNLIIVGDYNFDSKVTEEEKVITE